jgi:rod shape-determining protein MreD
MGKIIIINFLRFILLVTLQIFVFSKVDLFGFINPYPYILFLLLFPVWGNKNILLISSFLLGFCVDLFSNSGGVHAMASLFLAYIRPSLLNIIFGSSFENQTLNLTHKFTSSVFFYISFVVLIHHLIIFTIEIFSFTYFTEIISRTLFSGIFTMLICIMTFLFLKPNRK